LCAGTSLAVSQCAAAHLDDDAKKEDTMGKYFLAWLLGVPAGLLVLIYVFMHL